MNIFTHSVHCFDRALMGKGEIFELYHTGQKIMSSSPYCTQPQANLGYGMLAVLSFFIVFSMFAYNIGGSNKWDAGSERFAAVFGSLLLGAVTPLVLVAVYNWFFPILGITLLITFLVGWWKLVWHMRDNEILPQMKDACVRFFKLFNVAARLEQRMLKRQRELETIEQQLDQYRRRLPEFRAFEESLNSPKTALD